LVASVSFAVVAPGLTHSNLGGGVTVKVTYLVPPTAGETRFEVVLDTHTANLEGYDLKQLAMLRDETGKTYEPIRIENKGSGHHREVIVVFPEFTSGAKQFELVVKGIAGVKERTFRWDLK
jgi:hypothetical protein